MGGVTKLYYFLSFSFISFRSGSREKGSLCREAYINIIEQHSSRKRGPTALKM